jgi:hypothetical protein
MTTRMMLLVLALALTSAPAFAEDAPTIAPPGSPKYGPTATRLFDSREHVRKAKAPDFWALMPYYHAQIDRKSCSTSVVLMMVNGARARMKLTAADELAFDGFPDGKNRKGVTDKVKSEVWMAGLATDGKGVVLDDMGQIVSQAFKAYGLEKVKVETVHAEKTAAFRKKLHSVLVENEKSDSDFLAINFLQSEFTGDPEGAVGHYAPVAAYDVRRGQVLILDPDREYYEPYWVSEETLLAGMATADKVSGKNRGYVWVKAEK